MPENINHELEGTIQPSDYGVLSLDMEKARETLAAISPRSYGYAEKGMVKKTTRRKNLSNIAGRNDCFQACTFHTDRCPFLVRDHHGKVRRKTTKSN